MPKYARKRGEPSGVVDGWTHSRLITFIRSNLRRSWAKFPNKFKAMDAASRPYKGTDKRRKKEYQCSECKKWFKQKEVQVDHINPAGTFTELDDLPQFCANLFCGLDNLQVLCKDCHLKKTALERKDLTKK